MRAILIFISAILWSSIGYTQQEETLILEGRVEEGTVRAIVHKNARDQYIPLEQVSITILNEDKLVKTIQTDTAGDYRLTLFPDKRYSITFHKEGYLDKTFEIDGRKYNQNKNRAHMLDSDVALFRDLENEELRNYVQIPSASASTSEIEKSLDGI